MTLPPVRFLAEVEREGIALPMAARDKLAGYVDLLLAANRRFNLTAIRQSEEVWSRHILESLALGRLLGGATSVADIGSGCGVPGLPLAIAMADVRFALIESVAKKSRFLSSVVRGLSLDNVEVLAARAEDVGREERHRGAYDVAVSRAVGALSELIELALPLLRTGGRLLAVKGRSAAEEVGPAAGALAALGGRVAGTSKLLPAKDLESVVLEVVKDKPTPDRYPRRAGVPRKRPL